MMTRPSEVSSSGIHLLWLLTSSHDLVNVFSLINATGLQLQSPEVKRHKSYAPLLWRQYMQIKKCLLLVMSF